MLRRVVPQVQERGEGQLLLGPVHRRQVQRPLPLAGSNPRESLAPPLRSLLQRASTAAFGPLQEHSTGRKECVAECDCTVPCGEYLYVRHPPDQSTRGASCSLARRLDGSAQLPCGVRLQDHRNASLREWLVKEHVMGASSGGTDGLSNPNVTGFCKIAILSRFVRCPSR